ncbi:MAG: helix-turn-helix domain-containing protein [Ilumatobacteraceae bacterium]
MTTRQDDRTLANEALARLRRRPNRFTLPDGQTVRFPKAAVDGLIEVLEAVAEGETATVTRTPRELTTQQAADLLNISRPTVIRLINDGELPARKVGSHRRIPLAAVRTYREQMIAGRRQALDEMMREAEELGLYD